MSRVLTLLALVVLALAAIDAPLAHGQEPVRIKCSYAGIRCFEQLWEAWREQSGMTGEVHGRANASLVEDWVAKKCQAIVHSGPLASYHFQTLAALAPPEAFVEREIGRFAVAVAVHPTNPVRSMTMSELSGVFQGKIKNWSKIRGGRMQEIALVGQSPQTNAYYIVQQRCFRAAFVRDDLQVRDELNEVLAFVRRNPSALGFFLHVGEAPEGVRLLELAPESSTDERTDPVPLSAETVHRGTWPLHDSLCLVTHRQNAWAHGFYRFVASPAGGKIVSEWKASDEWPEPPPGL
jgi:hypothetical protein